jgi:hypothetical protein
MPRRRTATVLALLLALAATALLGAGPAAAKPTPSRPPSLAPPPSGFFGIGPQDWLTDKDAAYMKAGGIETVRVLLDWGAAQPEQGGPVDWGGMDKNVAIAARHGLRVLAFVYDSPRWAGATGTTLPLGSPLIRAEWQHFLTAATERYGPEGDFWQEYGPNGVDTGQPVISNPLPIRTWQIWNEANFFYFTYPVSPVRYGRLLKISSPAIKAVDPGAQVITAGLFGAPDVGGKQGMPAAEFLSRMYRMRGIKKYFDGISLHAYVKNVAALKEVVSEYHSVAALNEDPVPMYITEMGWGSQDDPKVVSFERGYKGQATQLRKSYGWLLANREALNLKSVFWFSWKDRAGQCDFCDSVGLFGGGEGFDPKPAWYAFVHITGGSLRPE